MTIKNFTVQNSLDTTGVVGASVRPTLNLNFAKTKSLDPRITFTRASSGTYFDASGVMRTVTADIPRFDHVPSTGESLGLLIEEQRQNVVLNTATTTSQATISTGTITAPDGNLAFVVVPTAGAVAFSGRGNSQVQIFANSSTTGQINYYTFSGYFAPYGPLNYQPYIVITAYEPGFTNQSYALIAFNATAGTFSTKSFGTGWVEADAPRATLLPCGMWRITWSVSYTQQATLRTTVGTYFQILSQAGATSYTADGASGVQYAFMQFEQGNFATSYIPTTTIAATRITDNASMPTAGWYVQNNGTMYFSFTPQSAGAIVGSTLVLALDTSGRFGYYNSGTLNSFDSTNVSSMGSITRNVNQRAIVAISSEDSTIRRALNGVFSTSPFDGTFGADTTTLLIGQGGSGRPGPIADIKYYPIELSDTELQVLTTA